MSTEKPVSEETETEKAGDEKTSPVRRGSRSAFAPIVLIALGVFFLLENLGVVNDLNWPAAWRFWPLALIFLGLNVLVVQLRRPVGTILSALVALGFVATFGYLLLSDSTGSVWRSLGLPAPRAVQEESFNLTPGAAETAAITLHLANYPSRIAAGNGDDLIAGSIWTRSGLDIQPNSDSDDHFEVSVGELPGGFVFDPGDWAASEDRTWEFYLSPDLPIDLHIDAGNAGVSAELAGLALSNLVIDAANGGLSASLPEGDYDIQLDGGNGGIDLSLPEGPRRVGVDGGNGGITLLLPAGTPARVEYKTGNGGMDVDGRFERVAGDNDEGVYETDNFDGTAGGVVFVVNTGNGQVNIDAP